MWEMLKATYPFFAEHEHATARIIPVVALTPPETVDRATAARRSHTTVVQTQNSS